MKWLDPMPSDCPACGKRSPIPVADLRNCSATCPSCGASLAAVGELLLAEEARDRRDRFLADLEPGVMKSLSLLWYMTVGIVCLAIGALFPLSDESLPYLVKLFFTVSGSSLIFYAVQYERMRRRMAARERDRQLAEPRPTRSRH